MSTNYNTILDDMKYSLRMAWKSALSYFLANLGMLIVIAILGAIIALPIAVAGWVALAPMSEHDFMPMATWAQANPIFMGGLGLGVMVLIVSLFLIVEGSIYGMSHDLVTTGETKAEAAFSYLRHKFLTFAGTGAMLAIFIVIPPVTVWAVTSYSVGGAITAPVSLFLSVFTFIWLYFTSGLTAMVWPAVVSGKGVQAAFKESFSLSSRYFERVFGVLTAVVLLIAVTFGPIVVWAITQTPFVFGPPLTFLPLMGVVMAWTFVSVILWIFLFLPAVRIAYVRVYQDLTGGRIASQTAISEVPIV
ncbi:MAG: hypothetical protein ACP6KW_12505 [Candidatus Thorarchaeota archaeon]